jgi:hypothetical protein
VLVLDREMDGTAMRDWRSTALPPSLVCEQRQNSMREFESVNGQHSTEEDLAAVWHTCKSPTKLEIRRRAA